MEYQEKLIILPVKIKGFDETLNITAYEAVGFGLAYHVVAGGDESDGFVIIHLESKKALCNPVRTEHEVKLLMEKVAELTIWTQSEEELKKKPWIGAEFLKCQQTIKSELNMQLETAMHTCMPDYLIEDVMSDIEDDILRTALLYAFKIAPSNVG